MTLSDLEKSESRLLTFRSLIYGKVVPLGHILLINTNTKSYMESTAVISDLSDLERSKSRSLRI